MKSTRTRYEVSPIIAHCSLQPSAPNLFSMDEDFDLESLIRVEQTSASGLLIRDQILSQ